MGEVTIDLSLEDTAVLVAALQHWRAHNRWVFRSLHATDDERKAADLQIMVCDRMLDGR